jgi:hypothetical protein
MKKFIRKLYYKMFPKLNKPRYEISLRTFEQHKETLIYSLGFRRQHQTEIKITENNFRTTQNFYGFNPGLHVGESNFFIVLKGKRIITEE